MYTLGYSYLFHNFHITNAMPVTDAMNSSTANRLSRWTCCALQALQKLHRLLALIILLLLTPFAGAALHPPELMLAKVYHSGISLSDYWISEKYDGVRGFWDGKTLWTRGGELVITPAWFTSGWPDVAMDGELWAGRGRFGQTMSVVRQQSLTADSDADWQGLRFMVFDLPAHGSSFTNRIPDISRVVAGIGKPWVQAVPQVRATSHAALQLQLMKVVKLGAEGLMLHRGESLYRGVRSDDLLKVKTHEDAEGTVIGHVPGKGKYAGQLGALLLEIPGPAGKPALRFKLGTGFTNAVRQQPPIIGSRVTYRFRGLNDSGIPRFASFMRVAG